MSQNNQNSAENRMTPSDRTAPSAPEKTPKKGGKKREKKRVELTHRRIVTRSRVALILLLLLLGALVLRLAALQLIDKDNYADHATRQYTYEIKLEAKRGTIYASDGKTRLAASATTQTVFISPYDVYKAGENLYPDDPLRGEREQLAMIAEGMEYCLDDYDAQTMIDQYNALGEDRLKRKYMVVKKDIGEDEEERVRAFISDGKLELQVALEEGTKRYYPYNTLASQLLGFVGSDNTGLTGLEYAYNKELSGIDGRAVRAQDANGNELAYNYETYIEAQDGLNLVTTIDWTIQSIVEKHLAGIYREHEPQGRVSCIVMDVKTGEIYAIAIYPSFDLNNYTVLSEPYQQKLDAYEGEDVKSYRSTLLNEMWNNTIVTQTYEPGSTFKVMTAAMALESKAITTTETFNCGGGYKLAGQTIHCWKKGDHGHQNIKEALIASCNPAFVQIGLKVGQETFKHYFEEFGYTSKTGTDIPGEVNSIYYDTTGVDFTDLSLAVYSFGQTFKITMLQHIAAVSSIANGGMLVRPHVGKYLEDQNGNIVKTFSTEPVRQVVSKKVCEDLMAYLVNSTQNANVSGYNVISKTGTSEKRDTPDEDDYIGSCITFAPAEDPQIAILITVDTPTGAYGYYGSQVAAPAISRILTEVLPYLGISPSEQGSPVEMVKIPDYRGLSSVEAESAAKALGLKVICPSSGTVIGQLPKADTEVAAGGTVVLYTNDTVERAVVPNVQGKDPETAIALLQKAKLNVRLEGIYKQITEDCYVHVQSVPVGETVDAGTVIVLECRYKSVND